jgi:putative CocE/NonD family hydrolase
MMPRVKSFLLLFFKKEALALIFLATPAMAQSETPQHFTERTASFDYVRRDVMIPMRDGVHLHTVILLPKNAAHAPMLFTRTPYNADELTSYGHSGHLAATLDGYDNAPDIVTEGGYIRVVQDVRGKYKSEGDYVMNRPLQGPLNPTRVDHATDTYDTIDWLVHNVPESNGRVGTIGISYDGFTTLMSLVHPHPALKVAVPMNPMVDGWRGDDWFHNGAFRQLNLNYIYEQEATRANDAHWWTDHYDDYDAFLAAGSADAMAQTHDENQVGFYRKLVQHPNYDSWWQQQAMDKILAREKLTVPTMLVHSLWDQEDIYGAIAVYKALKPQDSAGNLHLVMGPWHHGQGIEDGSAIGAIPFGSDTGLYFRQHILRPFLDHYLKDGAPADDTPPVSAFESGTNRWLALKTWPSGCDTGCITAPTPLYLQPNAKLGFDRPANDAAPASYISDPAHPVPFIQRPIHLLADGEADLWRNWLASDQREASTRPDVLTYETAPLQAPLKLAGEPEANLAATTTGTDGDFVVKLIDVYPDEMPFRPTLAGYQLMVSADILRGRFRDSFETPKAIPANQQQHYHLTMPTLNHVFLPGHRVMVQIQSSWFPLYDRNPQSYVDNVFLAQPGDYRVATISVAQNAGSFVVLPVVNETGK